MPEPHNPLSSQQPVIAIDPGRSKVGIAVVDPNLEVLRRVVVPTSDLSKMIQDLCSEFLPCAIVLGNGTGSGPIQAVAEGLALGVPMETIDEEHTSEEARARYLREVPARGIHRFFPFRSLRTPETPYDDFVAVILAERWWAAKSGIFTIFS